MKISPISSLVSTVRALLACCVMFAALGFVTSATGALNDYFWDADGSASVSTGGSGTWNTSSLTWRNDTNTGVLVTYPASGTNLEANFEGIAGTVTLGSNIGVNQLFFTTSGYRLNGDSMNSFAITLNGGSPSSTANAGVVAAIQAPLLGSGGFTKWGSGTLVLSGTNTFTGTKSLNAGILRVATIGTTASSSSNLGGTGGLAFGGGTLEYTGAGENTNRPISFSASSRLDNLGYGSLTLSSNFTSTHGLAATFTTGGSGDLHYAGEIGNGSATTALQVVGSGSTTLSAANTFTGGIITGRAQNLILDYSINPTVVSTTNTVTMGTTTNGGSTLTILGKASGSTAQTLGNLTFSIGQNKIVVDKNGGAGTSLTLGTLTRNSTGNLLLDLSSGGTLQANLNANPGVGVINLVDGVLVSGQTTTGSPGVIVRTGTNAYDFATGSSAGTNATISALAASTELPTSGAGGTGSANNYLLSSSKLLSSTTNLTVSTLRVDTTAGAGGTLTIPASRVFTLGKNTLLFDGTGDYTLAGPGSLTGSAAMFMHQWSTGTVTIGADVVFGVQRIDKFGTGLLINNSTSTNLNGLNVYGGVYRAGSAASLSTGNIAISSGGVLELTSDFTRSLGTGAAAVQFFNEGGFSAFGAERVVAFGGIGSPTALTWGSTANFVPSGNKLVLGAGTGNATVDFRNPIDFNRLQREFYVGNGSAEIDAKLSGILSGTMGSGLYKSGAGTLELTGTNSYQGATTVAEGTLIVSGALSGTTTVEVGDQAILRVDSTVNAGSLTTIAAGGRLQGGGTLGDANVSGTIAPGNSVGTLSAADVSLLGGSTFELELDIVDSSTVTADLLNVSGDFSLAASPTLNMLNLGDEIALDLGTVITFVDYTGSWTGGTFAGLADDTLFTMFGNTFSLSYNGVDGLGTALTLEVVPEPSSTLLFLTGFALFLARRRSRDGV